MARFQILEKENAHKKQIVNVREYGVKYIDGEGDVFSRLQIEKLLLEYEPTMLFVEHDERFREKIATETIVL